ncbi:hypothetical protein PVAND_011244 [Polypedilum vanderplanki]|uniref:CN hydrolase domain-containing protein n=1 Tax=Polypedilum vanderplanki TaxID=319348 RepID=A0A9J6CII6_POLVA|nr:hypothetical protein PVAND_011244 [Polypedilum vanderplanki]
MKKLLFIIFISLNIILITKCEETEEEPVMNKNDVDNETSKYYIAAVLEFNAPGDEYNVPEQIIDANLKEYIKWIFRAKEHNVDILVFSEASLNYNGLNKRDDLIEFAIELPEEISDDNYGCDYTSNFILNELSEAVSNASIYVLVNIVEKRNESDDDDNDVSLFNTNIVFDRNGCIVSRYRKFNLFIEPNINRTKESELSFFETDFGVTFGHFICFDILFKAPAYDLINLNISHFLYPSMWFSEVPFLTSIQIQQHYAYRNNIVLLSSGTNSPSNSNTGSGIFIGKHGAVESIISYINESKMIVAKVPKDVNDSEYCPEKPTIKPYTSIEMDRLKLWSNLPKSALTYSLNEGSIIHENGLECEFSIDFTRLSDEEQNEHEEDDNNMERYGYRLIAFNGIRNYANISNGGEIYCAIVACINESDPMTCGMRFQNSEKLVPSVLFHSIKIKATIDENESSSFLIMPTTLDFSIRPLSVDDFEFSVDEKEENVQMYNIEATNELSEIFTFGIFGRNFERDHLQITEDNVEMIASTMRINDEYENIEEIEEVHKIKEAIRGQGDPNVYLTVAIYVPLMILLCITAAILVRRRLREPYEHPLIILRRKSEMPQLS